ncbi:hypothetical protein PAXRUDRAFT_545872 [Paxillus rubicundulus Ve08.2h10]|uniref:Uncharacterized protein n=1 Tax=Paxillus rubicundulus Ve08.2h10 TaxID=930991 RepID=A0A0D0E5Y4_9AGAM|nr:hypothetical protein PAXRUDRAFT_545872 [Paxillus rubicundulus Ve08.2h10]
MLCIETTICKFGISDSQHSASPSSDINNHPLGWVSLATGLWSTGTALPHDTQCQRKCRNILILSWRHNRNRQCWEGILLPHIRGNESVSREISLFPSSIPERSNAVTHW